MWSPHNPDYSDDVLKAYRRDHSMFQKRIAHDVANGLPVVEVVTGFGARQTSR